MTSNFTKKKIEMKPIKAKDLLELDKHLEVVKLQGYPIPEQVIW